jgi:hypothetical protein
MTAFDEIPSPATEFEYSFKFVGCGRGYKLCQTSDGLACPHHRKSPYRHRFFWIPLWRETVHSCDMFPAENLKVDVESNSEKVHRCDGCVNAQKLMRFLSMAELTVVRTPIDSKQPPIYDEPSEWPREHEQSVVGKTAAAIVPIRRTPPTHPDSPEGVAARNRMAEILGKRAEH